MSDAAAHPILPPRFAAESSRRYDDAKLAVTIVGRVEEKTSDIIGLAWVVSATKATNKNGLPNMCSFGYTSTNYAIS